ncbi:MAG TPA: TRAP transporter small permease [bacterium]|nr:TRAP transporter small permease [bacterium]
MKIPEVRFLRKLFMLEQINRISDSIGRIAKYIVIVLTFIMIVVVVAQVFCRFVLGFSLFWSEELAKYLMAGMVFIGTSIAIQRGEMAALTFVQERFPKPVTKALVVLSNLGIITLMSVVGWSGLTLVIEAVDQTTATLGIAMAVPFAVIPLGSALIVLQALRVLFNALLKPSEIPSSKA